MFFNVGKAQTGLERRGAVIAMLLTGRSCPPEPADPEFRIRPPIEAQSSQCVASPVLSSDFYIPEKQWIYIVMKLKNKMQDA